jgi:hypothetical protein
VQAQSGLRMNQLTHPRETESAKGASWPTQLGPKSSDSSVEPSRVTQSCCRCAYGCNRCPGVLRWLCDQWYATNTQCGRTFHSDGTCSRDGYPPSRP